MLRARLGAVFAQLLRPLPLLRYLVLRTEVHAYSAGLAFFAMLAFYPFSLLLLSLAKYVFSSEAAHAAVQELLRELYPTSQEFLLRNLEASSWQFGEALTGAAVFWVLLGAAGIFIPLETALNQVWGFAHHRPYWRNQLVGLLLTLGCCGLAALAVLGIAAFSLRPLALAVIALAYVVAALFLLFRFLPNGPVASSWALSGALLGGVMLAVVRWLFLLCLPGLDLEQSQGPYHVSVSFLLLAYFETFAILGAALAVAEAARRLPNRRPGDDGLALGISGRDSEPEAESGDGAEQPARKPG